MTVNQKIRIIRKEKNIPVSTLAEKVGINQSVLTRYETGVIKYVPLTVIHKIAEELDCKVDDLIDGDERYTQKKKRRNTSTSISPEEYEMIKNYRNLPMKMQSLIRDMCSLRISVSE